jgi:hypothetical protein
MRSLAPIALFILSSGMHAQSLAEHAAAAGGATIGTAAGKPMSNAITKIFGQVNTDAGKAAKNPNPSKPLTKTVAETPAVKTPVASSSTPSAQPSSISHRRAYRTETVAHAPEIAPTFTIVPVEPPPTVKQATVEELALIKIGTSEKDLVEALGRPHSRITIPEEGHMLETLQYRANGKPLGTIRLDNGQVVTIEPVQN